MANVAPLLTPDYAGHPRIIDQTGQEVLLRGVDLNPGAAPLVYQKVLGTGLNFVRLPLYWSLAEPTPPSGSGTDPTAYVHTWAASYLAAAETTVQYMQQHNIYVEVYANFVGWSPAAPFSGSGGIPSWFYTDPRFPGVNDLSASQNNAAAAQSRWWTRWLTDPGNFTFDQYFYLQFWTEVVRRFSAYGNVVMYGMWDEPAFGTLAGSTQKQRSDDVHGWLSWVVNSVQTIEPQRMKAIGVISDMLNWGTADFAAFGGADNMQRKHMILDFHEVYSGKAPGFPANAATPGDLGLDSSGDALVGGFNATHTMITGSSYAGSLSFHENLLSVPRAAAARVGLPLMLGKCGVFNGDPGRLAYIGHMQQLMDAHGLSGAAFRLLDTGTSAASAGLLTNGVLNDMGTAWSNWWQATDFTRGVGAGEVGGLGLSTAPDAANSTPNYYHPGYNGTTDTQTGRVNDVLELNGVIYVAGNYDTVQDVDGTVLTNVPYLSAYRADTGAVIRTWQTGMNGNVRRLVVASSGTIIYAFGSFTSVQGGLARQSMVAFTALTGPTDTTASTARPNPSNIGVNGGIWDAIVDGANLDAWVVGDFTTVGGVARRGVAKFNLDSTGVWTLDTTFNASVPAFVGGGGGRALALKPDRTILVVGWFPGATGTDVSNVPSLTAYNAGTGAAAAWANKVYYSNSGDPHPGVNGLASDAGGVFVAGLWNGGASLVYLNWTGAGPNTVTFGAGVAPVTPGVPATSASAFWYWGVGDVAQTVALGRLFDQPVVFVGHRGTTKAPTANQASISTDPGNNGLLVVSQVTASPSLGGFGGPPGFFTPNTAFGVDTKVWAIYQTPGPGDLLVGGDFTSVNSSPSNSYQRFARFAAVATPTAWNPAPTLSDPTPVAGQTITADPGVPPAFTGSPLYQWQRSPTGASSSWVNIPGATSPSYTVDQTGADNNFFLRCQVTINLATGGQQVAYATSSSAVTAAPTSPVLTGTQPQITPNSGLSSNQLLTVTTSPADWTPSSGVTFVFQWFRQKLGATVPVGTGSTYTTSTLDVGAQIFVTVTATATATGLTGTAKSNIVTVGSISGTGRIFFFSDAGSGIDAQTITTLIPDDADLVVYGGDVYPRDTSADYTADISGLLSPAKMASLVQLCGNHDWPNRSCGGGYYAQVGALAQHAPFTGTKDYGKITIAGWDLIFLNTNRAAQAVVGDCSETTPIVDDSQLGLDATETAQLNTWLNAAGTQKIVFGHSMRYSPSTTHLDDANFDQMWNALQGRCVAYIHGHAHNYSRQRPRDGGGLSATDPGFVAPGVVDICAGTGGEGNYDPNATYPAKYVAFFRGASATPSYGYLRITPTGNQVTIDFIDEDGISVIDTVTLTATTASKPTAGIPTLSDPTPFVGETLSGTTGQWQGSTPMTFQVTVQHSFDGGATWQTATGIGAQQTMISQTGQAPFTYSVNIDDLGGILRATVNATNSVGATLGATQVTQAVAATGSGVPTLVTLPTVSPVAPFVGILEAVTNGDWNTPPADPVTSYSYQWLHWSSGGGFQPIPGANSQTYTAQATDAGFALACDVIASNTAGDSVAARSGITATVTSQGIFVNDQIDTPDNQVIAFGQPFTVVWEAATNAPAGIFQSRIRLDGGAWLDGTKISDDGHGATIWSYTFQTLPVGSHIVETEDIVNT